MITFKSINVDGNIRHWTFESFDEIKKIWNSDFPDLPANDDPVFDLVIDGTEITGDMQIDNIGTDEIWFEDIFDYEKREEK